MSDSLYMSEDRNPQGEDYQIRCPRLGHQVSFSYCRIENSGLPCFKALDCWFRHFSVEEFLQKEISPDQWEKIFCRPPKNKMLSLVELIERAQKKKKEA